MPIGVTDLIALGSLNRPEDDTSLVGGGIDIDNRPVFAQLAANDTVQVKSDNAGDTTQNVTVTGRDAAGAEVSEVLGPLTGVTPVVGTQTFERVLKVVMDADAVGIITVERTIGPTLIETIPIGERGFYGLFIKSASESAATTRFEKFFWKNNHGSLTLSSATVELTADPAAKIRMGLEAAKNDSNTATNRKTAPGGVTFVDDNVSQAVPGNTLEAASAIGTWMELALAIDDPPVKDTFTTELAGTSV